jgi:hypothetical protein
MHNTKANSGPACPVSKIVLQPKYSRDAIFIAQPGKQGTNHPNSTQTQPHRKPRVTTNSLDSPRKNSPHPKLFHVEQFAPKARSAIKRHGMPSGVPNDSSKSLGWIVPRGTIGPPAKRLAVAASPESLSPSVPELFHVEQSATGCSRFPIPSQFRGPQRRVHVVGVVVHVEQLGHWLCATGCSSSQSC